MSKTQVGHCKRDTTDVYVGRGRDADDMLDVTPTHAPHVDQVRDQQQRDRR